MLHIFLEKARAGPFLDLPAWRRERKETWKRLITTFSGPLGDGGEREKKKKGGKEREESPAIRDDFLRIGIPL